MNYEERLEKAKRLYETANADQRYVLESLFPEIKESDAEYTIPFGAKDSELIEETYYIPEGMEAVIDGNKVVIKKKESDDEKNIKDLIDELKRSLRAANCQNEACNGGHEKRIALLEWALAWLEKQKHDENHWKPCRSDGFLEKDL